MVQTLDGLAVPTLAQVEAELFSRSLREFVEGAWHLVEPAARFKDNWHIGAICEHLEAVTAGEIKRLIINQPPRTMKSLTSAVFWPAWVWTSVPSFRWLFSSYAQSLATRDSVKCRRVVQSTWYQERWGSKFKLTTDQNVKVRFENDKTGYRIATSVDGAATGEGGDAVVVDDPVNYREAESEAHRTAANDWWDMAMSTRLNDPETGARVIQMQRLHEDDLSGHALAHEGDYVHLMLPMRYDPSRRCVTVLGWEDPRTTEGELLWPEHFPDEVVRSLEADLGPYGTAGQLQQSPTARQGGQFERAWFEVVDREPGGPDIIRVRFWDKAGTEGGGKYTCGTRMSYRPKDRLCFVEDVVRGQWGAGNRERIIKETAESDALRFGLGSNGETRPNKLAVLNMVEQEPGSGGKDQALATIVNLAGYRIEAETATGDKFVRADPLAGAAKAGTVKVVKGPWNEQWFRELEAAGPGAAYLDQMDSASGAYNRIMRMVAKTAPKVGVDLVGLTQSSPWSI